MFNWQIRNTVFLMKVVNHVLKLFPVKMLDIECISKIWYDFESEGNYFEF